MNCPHDRTFSSRAQFVYYFWELPLLWLTTDNCHKRMGLVEKSVVNMDALKNQQCKTWSNAFQKSEQTFRLRPFESNWNKYCFQKQDCCFLSWGEWGLQLDPSPTERPFLVFRVALVLINDPNETHSKLEVTFVTLVLWVTWKRCLIMAYMFEIVLQKWTTCPKVLTAWFQLC